MFYKFYKNNLINLSYTKNNNYYKKFVFIKSIGIGVLGEQIQFNIEFLNFLINNMLPWYINGD
jgi:hypothetical protein